MAFLALSFFRESSQQTCLQPDSGVYSIETSEARPPPNYQLEIQTAPLDQLLAIEVPAEAGELVIHRHRSVLALLPASP
jgi:hypothetical protein